MRLPMRVWDLPTRLFHWAIVLLVVLCYVSIEANWVRFHFWCGYAVLALVLFRLLWGVVGSETARFSAFLRSPLAGLAYLLKFRRSGPDDQVGHNEAGGWMVLMMIALLLAISVTGLFANDQGSNYGPLTDFVSDDTSGWLSVLHGSTLKIALFVAIGLHLAAIAAYAVVKRHDLVRPMITGKKLLPAATRAPRLAPNALAAIILAAAVLVVVLIATVA
jgi:cytochrome b